MISRDEGCDGIIKHFEAENQIKTYDFETTESFSANYNVLITNLPLGYLSTRLPQIIKTFNFMCQKWYLGY